MFGDSKLAQTHIPECYFESFACVTAVDEEDVGSTISGDRLGLNQVNSVSFGLYCWFGKDVFLCIYLCVCTQK